MSETIFQLSKSCLTAAQRKELLDKGPYNLVFHGIQPDWIEAEMDDDPEFKRDVLEQKIRTLMREDVRFLLIFASLRTFKIGLYFSLGFFEMSEYQIPTGKKTGCAVKKTSHVKAKYIHVLEI